MRPLFYTWTTLVFSSLVTSAVVPTPAPDTSSIPEPTGTPTEAFRQDAAQAFSTGNPVATAIANKVVKSGNCNDAYTPRDVVLNFDGLRQYCFRVCNDFVTQSLTYERGSGWANYLETSQPLLFPNADAWSVLNCSALPSGPEGQACGLNPPGSAKALLSGGSSLYDSNRAPRLGTLEYAKDYLLFDLKSLYVTPIVKDITIYTNVKVHIKGLAKDGRTVSHTATVLANFRHLVTVGAGFTKLSALDIWIEKPGSTTKYPFAIDDISIVEHVPVEKPASCYATSTFPPGTKGPCKPKPTATKTWTINFDNLPANTLLPDHYGDITWGNEYAYVHNTSTDPLQNFDEPVGPPSPPSRHNYITNSGNNVALLSSTFEERFGLKEVSVLCRFPPFQEGDPNLTNGKPCVITFVGKRDKYDGSGLPQQVIATYSIPNPNITNGAPRPFTKIKLDPLTKQPGGFRRLYRLEIFAEIGDYRYFATAAFDNFVLTRERGEGTSCRAGGLKTLNFDDLSANAAIPSVYKGFKFIPEEWTGVQSIVGSYPAGAPLSSKPNALRVNLEPYGHSIDSYLDANPANRRLFDFESLIITANVPLADTARLNALRISFGVQDACGIDTIRVQDYQAGPYSSAYAYYDSVQAPLGVQLKFARPFYAVSKVNVRIYYDYDSPFSGETVSFWIDDFKYRENGARIPPCRRCGYRGAGFCEWPRITAR